MQTQQMLYGWLGEVNKAIESAQHEVVRFRTLQDMLMFMARYKPHQLILDIISEISSELNDVAVEGNTVTVLIPIVVASLHKASGEGDENICLFGCWIPETLKQLNVSNVKAMAVLWHVTYVSTPLDSLMGSLIATRLVITALRQAGLFNRLEVKATDLVLATAKALANYLKRTNASAFTLYAGELQKQTIPLTLARIIAAATGIGQASVKLILERNVATVASYFGVSPTPPQPQSVQTPPPPPPPAVTTTPTITPPQAVPRIETPPPAVPIPTPPIPAPPAAPPAASEKTPKENLIAELAELTGVPAKLLENLSYNELLEVRVRAQVNPSEAAKYADALLEEHSLAKYASEERLMVPKAYMVLLNKLVESGYAKSIKLANFKITSAIADVGNTLDPDDFIKALELFRKILNPLAEEEGESLVDAVNDALQQLHELAMKVVAERQKAFQGVGGGLSTEH